MGLTDLIIKDEEFKGRNIQSIKEDTVLGRAEELKRLFDAPAQEVLKEKINALIEYLSTEQSAKEIGTYELSDGSGTNVADQLNYLFHEMQSIYAGGIVDGSISDAKLSNAQGQIKQNVADHNKMMNELDLAPNNSIVCWKSYIKVDGPDDPNGIETKCFAYIENNTGALFAADGITGPKFGLLPVSCGGTGANNSVSAKTNLGIYKKLWAGSWSSGSITIPNWRDYSLFIITLEGTTSPVLLVRYYSYLRGIGGHITDGGMWTMSASFAINDDDSWQYAFAGFMGHTKESVHGTLTNNAAVTGIWGVC